MRKSLRNNDSIGRRTIVWGYLAQLSNVGAGILLLPVILRCMTSNEVGIWFVFITISGLAQLLEMGFLPTISRNISYIYAGAQEISESGIVHDQKFATLNKNLLCRLINSSKYIYKIIAALILIFLLLFGSLYIYSVLPKNINQSDIIISWVIFSSGIVINFYYGYLNSILQGSGNLIEYNKSIFYTRFFQVVLGSTLVFFGYGLTGLGISMLLSALFGRILSFKYASEVVGSEFLNNNYSKKHVDEIVKKIWVNASKFGVVMLAVFLVWRGNILIASSELGLEAAASYGLAIQIFTLINSLSTVPFNTSLPKLNMLMIRNKKKLLLKKFSILIVLTLVLYISFCIVIFFGADYLLGIITHSTKLPNIEILLFMMIVFFLELNHGTCANFLTIKNEIPFKNQAIITGISIFLLSATITSKMGMLGLVLGQFIPQIIYNNWKWPSEVAKIFKVKYTIIIFMGIKQIIFKSKI